MKKTTPTQLRILMLTEYFYPFDRGGSEWSVYHLSKSLLDLGSEVAVFKPNYGEKSYAVKDKIKIYRFPFLIYLKRKNAPITPFWHSNILWFVVSFVYLFITILKFKPTHIHIQGKYFIPQAVIAGKIIRLPVIVTLRDYIVLCPYAFCINRKNKYLSCSYGDLINKDLNLFQKNYLSSKNLISYFISFIAAIRGYLVSAILRFFLSQDTYKIAISKKVALIYKLNNIHVNKVIYNSISSVKAFPSKTKNYLVYAGRLTKGKGIDSFTKAYFSLSKTILLPKLLVIGDGPLKTLLKEYKLKNISLLGHLRQEEVLKVFRSAKAVVVPSIWEEPFGRVALEAIICQIPVLASNRGALPEIVINNRYGKIIEPSINNFKKELVKFLKNRNIYKKYLLTDKKLILDKFAYNPITAHLAVYKSL